MTERFMVDDAGTLIDTHTRNTYDYVSEVCSLLNKYDEENEQLKKDIKISDESETYSIETNLYLSDEIAKLKKENKELQVALNNRCVCKELDDIYKENEQLKSFIYGLTTKGTGRIDLANGYAYNIKAILTDFNIGDVE